MSDDYVSNLRKRYLNPNRYVSHLTKPLVSPEGYEYGWKTWYDKPNSDGVMPSVPSKEYALKDGWHPVGYLDAKWEIPRNADGYFAVKDAVLCMRIKAVEAAPLESYTQEDLLEEVAVRLDVLRAEKYMKELWVSYSITSEGKDCLDDDDEEYKREQVKRLVEKNYPRVTCKIEGYYSSPEFSIKRRVKQVSAIEQMLSALQVASELESSGKAVSRADHELAWKCAMDGIADIPEVYADGLEEWEHAIWKPIMESMDEKLAKIDR